VNHDSAQRPPPNSPSVDDPFEDFFIEEPENTSRFRIVQREFRV
jgi:hypothetical protein